MRRKRRTPAAVDNSAPEFIPQQNSTYRSQFGVQTSGATSLGIRLTGHPSRADRYEKQVLVTAGEVFITGPIAGFLHLQAITFLGGVCGVRVIAGEEPGMGQRIGDGVDQVTLPSW